MHIVTFCLFVVTIQKPFHNYYFLKGDEDICLKANTLWVSRSCLGVSKRKLDFCLFLELTRKGNPHERSVLEELSGLWCDPVTWPEETSERKCSL